MILAELKELVRQGTEAVLKSQDKEISVPLFELSIPPSKIPGDLASNVPLMLSKSLGQNPRDVATEIIKKLPKSKLINKVEIAGPGFINFWMAEEAFRGELEELLLNKKPKIKKSKKAEKYLVEFVSANPTGPLHVGHGRGAALGDSLVRIFRYLHRDVTTEFYVNDAGGQIRNLGFSMEARIKELKGEQVEFPENGYKGSYVIELSKEAIETKKKFTPIQENQMVFSEADLAGFASVRILESIKKTLVDFGVQFDKWFTESSLHKKDLVLKCIEDLKKKDLAYDQEGAIWFRATQFGDEKDRVLKKGTEAPTYFASDLAYHVDKFSRGYSKLINIWGADHHGYAQRLKGALKALGEPSENLLIIFNQLVSIKGGRLSKRAGDMILLQDVVDEVGRDATRFFFALRSPGAHFEFDLDLAKKQASDNPVYYVQYVHARCCSIFSEAEKRKLNLKKLSWKKSNGTYKLGDVEKSVLLHLMSFDDVLALCAQDLSTHHLTGYLIELAGKYHSFYEQCRVLDDDATTRSFRLDLIEAIRKRVAEGLQLLGVSAPERL